MDYDVLVVGSGIGGMESALKLGDMGYRVLVVEKEPSVGGRMVLLSKVFPTLDCASCIATPKMAATAHHPNVTVATDSEVAGISRDVDGGFPRPGPPQGRVSWTWPRARAAGSASRPAPWPSPTSGTARWCPGGPPTSPSRRPSRRRP